MANAFVPSFAVKDVLAELHGDEKFKVKPSGDLKVKTAFLEAMAKVVERKEQRWESLRIRCSKQFSTTGVENYQLLSSHVGQCHCGTGNVCSHVVQRHCGLTCSRSGTHKSK